MLALLLGALFLSYARCESNSIFLYMTRTNTTQTWTNKIIEEINHISYENITFDQEQLQPDSDVFNTTGILGMYWKLVTSKPILNFKPLKADLSKYDNIFIGFPVWGWNAPKDLIAFIKSLPVDWSKKHVFVYAVSNAGSERAIETFRRETGIKVEEAFPITLTEATNAFLLSQFSNNVLQRMGLKSRIQAVAAEYSEL